MTEFKLGDRVLAPGKIVAFTKYAECGVDCAIVETVFGNSIVEGVESLLPDARSPGERGEDRVETLSRAMCSAAGYNPDHKATRHMPPALASGFVVGSDFFPAWKLYEEDARALVNAGLV